VDRGIALLRDAVAVVDPDARIVHTADAERLGYDQLVIAIGARPVQAVPGAVTFAGSHDAERVSAVVDELRDGVIRSAAFVVPPGTGWSLPIYELALQTAHAAPGAEVHVVTTEHAPLAAFGPPAEAEVMQLLEDRRISLHASTVAERCAEGQLRFASGASVAADRVVALPHLTGPCLTGVPFDSLGFAPVDDLTRVIGVDAIHAVGDAAAHDVKQGGLASQQADVAARVIAAAAGVELDPQPYRPVLHGLLICGDEVRYLRRDATGACDVSDEPLWWPPHKVAGRHLPHYLASHTELALPAVS
jgi:sulfide:quinone oxidoreductase